MCLWGSLHKDWSPTYSVFHHIPGQPKEFAEEAAACGGWLTDFLEHCCQLVAIVWMCRWGLILTSTSHGLRELISLAITLHSCGSCCSVTSVVPESMWPHRRQPSRLPRPTETITKDAFSTQNDFLEQCLTVLQLNAPYCLVVKLKFHNQAVKIFHIQVLGDLIFPNAPSTL